MEHGVDFVDDVLSRSRGAYARTFGLIGQMREQNSNSNQDWLELKDAFEVSPGRLLFT